MKQYSGYCVWVLDYINGIPARIDLTPEQVYAGFDMDSLLSEKGFDYSNCHVMVGLIEQGIKEFKLDEESNMA